MDECINRSEVVALIEEKQKALCPTGRSGRNYVYGTDRDAYDAWQEIIDAIEAIPSVEIAPEPNPPLTLEELREIFGEPVFLTDGRGWRICYGVSDFGEEGPYMEVGYGVRVPLFDYGKTWLAYRRKPEEEAS